MTPTTLTITAKGQITLRRAVLEHLGVGPGDKLVMDLLPDGRATDVLGVCVAWGRDVLTVDRDGDRAGPVTIRIADVVTGKPVPPRASVRDRVSAREAEGHGFGMFPGMERVDLGEERVEAQAVVVDHRVGGGAARRTARLL